MNRGICVMWVIFTFFSTLKGENQPKKTLKWVETPHGQLEVIDIIGEVWGADFTNYTQILPDMRIAEEIKVASATKNITDENNRKFSIAMVEKKDTTNCTRFIRPQISNAYTRAHAGIKGCILTLKGGIQNNITSLLRDIDIEIWLQKKFNEYAQRSRLSVMGLEEKNSTDVNTTNSMTKRMYRKEISDFLQKNTQNFRGNLTSCFRFVQNYLNGNLTLVRKTVDECNHNARSIVVK